MSISLKTGFFGAIVNKVGGSVAGVFGGREMKDLEQGIAGFCAFANNDPNKAVSLTDRIVNVVKTVGSYLKQKPFAADFKPEMM